MNVFQYPDSAIMVVDIDEKYVTWNMGLEKIFGFRQGKIISKC